MMTTFFGDDYVTQITDVVFNPSGGQFGPEATGFNDSIFLGVGEDDLVGDTFSIGGPVFFNIPFVGETEIFRARLFGEVGAQFGLQLAWSLDPGSVDAILPYETVVGYPDFDLASIASGDIVDLFFGATFDPGADPDSGFTTAFPRLTFDVGILTELVVELAAEIGALGENDVVNILDFNVPETVLPIISIDTGRTITQEQADEDPNDTNEVGDANPIEIFGAVTTQDLVNDIPGLDPAFNDAGEFAGIGIPLNTFVSSPKSDKAETTDASPEGDETPDPGPPFDLSSIDLGKFEIFVPNINTVSQFDGEIFVTDPSRKAEYTFETDANGARVLDEDGRPIILNIDRVEDLDENGVNLGEGNRDDLVRLTLDLDGLITYATGGTFPPLELDIDLIDGSVAGINLDAGFSYNLLDVELEAALPLEQEFTLTPKLQTAVRFFENVNGQKGAAKPVEILTQRQVLLFDEAGVFQDEAVTARLRELAEGNATFATDIDLFLDLDQGIVGGFTGQTASVGGAMIISRDGGTTWVELNNGDVIAESAPLLGQDQTGDLELAEGTLLGYRLFIGSGSIEIREDFVIDFDKADSVYVEDVQDTSAFYTETPFLDDLNTLNIVYDDAETFVEIVSQTTPIVTNRTGLEFDLALILRGLAASAFFEASIDIGPLTVGAGLDFEIGPLFEEKFELLNLDIVDLFNDSFQLEDTETTSFILGAPAPETDFGDAIVGTTGNDTLDGTPEADIIIGLGGDDVIYGGDGDDLIQPGAVVDFGLVRAVTENVYGGEGFDTLSFQDISNVFDRGVRISNVGSDGKLGYAELGADFERLILSPFTDVFRAEFEVSPTGLPSLVEAGAGNDFFELAPGNATAADVATTILAGTGNDTFRLFSGVSSTEVFDQVLLDGGEGEDALDTFVNVDLSTGLAANGVRLANIENVRSVSLSVTSLTGDDRANRLTASPNDVTLDGRGGNDLLEGASGNDTLIGGAGADSLFGGDGLDTADYSTSATSVFVDLDFNGTGRGFRGDAQGDELDSIERVVGSDFNDILFGDNAANTLDGGAGDDRLQSQGANDLLQGGADNDLLNRGAVVTASNTVFNNIYDGGEGFDLVAVDVFSPFRVTGSHTGTARFTYTTGNTVFGQQTTNTDRTVTIGHRYDRSAHVELTLDESGNGEILYIENDASATFRATTIAGTASYSSRSSVLDAGWDVRTSTYNNNITDQTLAALDEDSISFPRGDFHAVSGTGRILSPGSQPSAVSGGELGREEVRNVEGLIGSRGNDELTGNSQANAFFGNGGSDLIRGGGGDDRLGFGDAQPLTDVFSFPGSNGSSAPGVDRRLFLDLEERLARMNPEGTDVDIPGSFPFNDWTPVGKIQINDAGATQDIGSFLWGQEGIDTLDMRFDRGLSFFPDTSSNYAMVDLNVASAGAGINHFTGEQVQYGRAEWFNAAGNLQAFATTFGVENVIGSRRDDTITGDRNDNAIEGLDGADVLDGDEGFDTASYALAEEGVTLNIRADGDGFALDNARATITGTGDATGDLAVDFEAYVGSDHDDIAVIEGGALVEDNPFTVSAILPQVGSTQFTVTGAQYDPDNLARTLELDLGDGDDVLVIEGLGTHDVSLGEGDDTATIRNIGHTLDAGAGNDTITVLDHEDLSLADLDPAQRVTTIDGGAGDDVVVFSGGDYILLEITDAGATVFERLDPAFSPETETLDIQPVGEVTVDLTQTSEFQIQQEIARGALAEYQLSGVEIVEINGERIRIDNPDPIVDPDTTLTIIEDQIDAYALDLLITQDEIDAGATFSVVMPPMTADLVLPGGGLPIEMGDVLTAAEMAALQVVPGQNFDPAADMFSYIRVGDPEDEARTATLPEPVRGVALNITSHLEEIEVVITPEPETVAEIALVRLNPAPVVGDGPTADELDYAIGSAFADMPTGAITFEMLFRSAGEYDPGIITTFVSYATSGNQNEFLIEDARDGNGLRILFAGTTISTGLRVDKLFDREVHRLSLAVDTDVDEVELFVDGISVFAAEVPGISMLAAGGTFTFGQEQDSVGGTFNAIQTLKGDVGDIRIWDGVRSEAEIADNAFSELTDPAAEADLAAYWQADTANEGVLVNAVGDTHLALVNQPEIVTAPEPEAPNVEVIPTIRMNTGAITNEYIQAANFNEMPTGPMTVEFIYQSPEDFDPSGTRQHLLSYAVPGGQNWFLLYADQSANNGQIGLIVTNTTTVVTDAPSSLLLDTEPHRLSVLFDPVPGTVEIYIDGERAGGGATPPNKPIAAGGSLIFGQEQDSVGGGFNPVESIAGDFGDIRVWDGLRTAEEIAATAFAPLADPANTPGLVANWQVDPENSSTVPNLAGSAVMNQFATPARASVQFDLPDAPEVIGPPIVVEVETVVVDQQGDPVTIVVDEVPTDGTVFYMAPDPVMLAAGFTFLVETPAAVGDTLTPDQLESLFFRPEENFTGDPGAFRYTVRDDVSFRDLSTTEQADQNNATDGDLRDGAASQTISFDVTPANDAPEVSNVLFPISPGAELRNNVRAADAEGDAFEVALLEGPSLGTVVVNPDGTFTYTQNAALDFEGKEFLEDRFTVQATESVPSNFNVEGDPAQSAPQEQVIRIINPAFQTEIVFDPNDPDFFDDDGNPILLGGLETDDVIRGHGGPDGLYGFGGDDSIFGEAGSDTIDGGDGDDSMEGGEGIDTLSFATMSAPSFAVEGALFGAFVDLSLQGTAQNTGQGNDIFTNFENLEGSDFADFLTGDAAANAINGGAGGDVLVGGDGDDTLEGGEGFDAVEGGLGADLLFGGTGGNAIEGDLATYFSATGPLVFDFGADVTEILAGSSAEVLEDTIGDDIEGVAGASDHSNTFLASQLTGLSFFLGGAQSDTFVGGSGTDQLIGLAGNDVMYGNDGGDALIGEGGDDDLFGGAGQDFFFFDAVNEGDDTIHDLELGIDFIFFTGGNLVDGDLTFADTVAGGTAATDTLITYEVGGVAGSITIIDHDAATIEANANIAFG